MASPLTTILPKLSPRTVRATARHVRARARSLPAYAAFLACALAPGASAAMEATTDDGRRVRLNDDQTWEFVEAEPGEAATRQVRSTLRLVSRKTVWHNCRVGFKLKNQFSYAIDSIVPQFSAITDSGVVLKTVFLSFSKIDPTSEQYQEAEFEGIGCDRFTRIKISGADRCSMGDLTKFSPEKGACLARIRVEPSDLIEVSK